MGWEHGCGLSSLGDVYCWGRNQQGQAQPPQLTEENFISVERVSVGRYHSCLEGTERHNSDDAVEEDRSIIRCWGRSNEGQLIPPDDLELHQVSAGWRETCALDEEGQVHCWGELDSERLPSSELRLSELHLSQGFGCGLDKTDASIHCWGRNEYRQAEPPLGVGYRSLSVGVGKHACAIDGEGYARCWGDTSDGKTLAPALPLKSLSVGRDHTCALTEENQALCWGLNEQEQISAPAGAFTWISSGAHFSCGLRAEGTLVCWGGLTPEPTPLFQQVAVGLAHTCALKVDQSLSCWGWPRAGRTLPPTGAHLQVDVGDEHSCAISSEGAVKCWGVGVDPTRFERDGDFDQASPPPDLGVVSLISVGNRHTCAAIEGGAIRCWGDNSSGQSEAPNLPWAVTQVTSGSRHSCALSESGQVACWGANDREQLSSPDLVFHRIDAGGDLTCGQTEDFSIACWGDRGSVTIPEGPFQHFSVGEETLCLTPFTDDQVVETHCETHSALRSGEADTPWSFILDQRILTALVAGHGQACALRADERLSCQGNHSPLSRPRE